MGWWNFLARKKKEEERELQEYESWDSYVLRMLREERKSKEQLYSNPAPDKYFKKIRGRRDNMSSPGDKDYDA